MSLSSLSHMSSFSKGVQGSVRTLGRPGGGPQIRGFWNTAPALRPLQLSMWLRSQTLEAYSPGLKSSLRTNLLCGLGQLPPSL